MQSASLQLSEEAVILKSGGGLLFMNLYMCVYIYEYKFNLSLYVMRIGEIRTNMYVCIKYVRL